MDEQLTNKVTIVGWLLLGTYAAFGVASGIAALTLDDDLGGDVAKRDRLYQLVELSRPQYVLLALAAALVGVLVHRLGRGADADRQATLMINVARVAAGLGALLSVALAISFATDDRDGTFINQWGELAKALAPIPLAAAVFLLPAGRTAAAAGTPTYGATTTGPQPAQPAPPTTQHPTTTAPPPPPGSPPPGV